MAIGAPSHIHGLSFTRKPQPMNKNSPRTLDCVVAARLARREWPGRWERGEGEAARDAAVAERPCRWVVGVPVLFNDKIPQS